MTFPELILIRGFRQTKCFDGAALEATSHSDTPLQRRRADISGGKWTLCLVACRDSRGGGGATDDGGLALFFANLFLNDSKQTHAVAASS